jgi:ubiquinone/menaquinone biosynthesis C-methylase UbiE
MGFYCLFDLLGIHIRSHKAEVVLIDQVGRDLNLPGGSIDAAFLNACYPNIVDKASAFANLSRMMKAEGRLVISHPLGKAFILALRECVPFPLDEFPKKTEAGALLEPFGFEIETFIDEPMLYILVATKCRFKAAVDKVE